MGIERSLQQVGRFTETIEKVPVNRLIPQMVELCRIGGKLPISSSFKEHVRSVFTKDSARVENIPGTICQDLLVPLRFLALSNQAFYSRGQTVTDLSVIGNLIGVSRVAEKFDELGQVVPFTQAFRGRALAMTAYQNTVLSALLAQRFFTCIEKQRFPTTLPFLNVIAAELPLFLLAYTKPHLYASCLLDSCAQDNVPIEKFFRKIMQRAVGDVFRSIATEAGIPSVFSDYVDTLSMAPWNRRNWSVPTTQQSKASVTAAYVSQKLGALIPRAIDRQDFYSALRAYDGKGELSKKIIDNAMVNVSSRFFETMQILGLPALRLAQYFQVYEDQFVDEKGVVSEVSIPWPPISARLNPFVVEIKAALQSSSLEDGLSRLPHVLASSALALLRGLDFDRVIIFAHGNIDGGNALVPRLTLGRKIEGDVLWGPLSRFDEYAPHKLAYEQQQAIFQGDPLIEDDWPFVAFPLIQSREVKGVIYADKKKEKNAAPLSTEEQVAIIALAEVFHEIPPLFQ